MHGLPVFIACLVLDFLPAAWYNKIRKGAVRMALAEVLRKEYHLSEEQITLVVNFTRFLEEQNTPKPIDYREDGTPIYRRAGALRGKIDVPDDFDEPLEEFKEYTK